MRNLNLKDISEYAYETFVSNVADNIEDDIVRGKDMCFLFVWNKNWMLKLKDKLEKGGFIVKIFDEVQTSSNGVSWYNMIVGWDKERIE